MVFTTRCAVCGDEAARIDLLSPEEFEPVWQRWPEAGRQAWAQFRTPTSHCLTYNGPGGGGGNIIIDANRAERIARLFSGPPEADALRKEFYDRAGFCGECQSYYCATHWSISATGFGECPRGYGKSLDPHWSPDIDLD